MKENLMLVLKGIIVGLGKIIPGVSGAMLAITLDIYDKCIDAISNFTKQFKKNIYFLGYIGTGIVLSIGVFSNLVIYLLDNHFFVTMCLFIGLIIGGFPKIYSESQVNVKKRQHIFLILISFLLIIFMNNLNSQHIIKTEANFFALILIGFVEAFAMIVPGISGTALLILLGYYEMVMFRFSQIFNFMELLSTVKFFIPFGLGMLIGVLVMSKLINFSFKNFKTETYSIIIGLIISSIYILFMDTIKTITSISQICVGFVLIVVGVTITYSLDSKFKSKG